MDRFWMWLSRRLPKRLRYTTVITTAADYTIAHPTVEVPSVTWADVTKWLEAGDA